MQNLPGNAVAVQDTSTLRPIAEAAFRHRRLWVLSVLGLLGLTFLYILLSPREYRSEMAILVQNRRGADQITPQRTGDTMMVDEVTEEQINSEIEVLRSRSLANRVVDPDWTDDSAVHMTAEQLHQHDKAVENFYKHLNVQMVRKSNVIDVTYTASDPHAANQVLTRLMNDFLTRQREIGHSPGAAHFFAIQAASYKQKLDAAQQKLAQFQQNQQIVSLDDTEQTLNRQIADAQDQLRATDAQISELAQQLDTQTSQLHRVPTRQATLTRSVPNEYSIEQLQTMLAQLQNQRTSLLTKFTPRDRFVQEVDKKIADTQAALSSARAMHSEEHSTDVNPVWQQLTASIVQNEYNRRGLQARHAALTAQVNQLQSQLASAEGSTVTYSTLKQQVAELTNNYQVFSQKRDEAAVSNAMDEDRLLNVAVTQSPTFAVTPYRPKPVVDAVLGGFTAVFLSCFLVFFAEMGRTTIATPRELDRAARYPALATVPLNSGQRRLHLPERAHDSARLSLAYTHNPFRGKTELSPIVDRHREEPQAS